MKTKQKRLGQFFTNPIIAEFMLDLILTPNTKRILDPAVGMGVFTKKAHSYNNKIQIEACEIDPEMIEVFQMENKYPCTLHKKDYLTLRFDKLFDAIICNPPYNKFQDTLNRKKLIADFYRLYKVSMSGYSNLCVYFLIKSINELEYNGRCCYIIPYEFMNAGYGIVVKKYLLESGMLRCIYKISNKINLFDESITTSCIIVLENSQTYINKVRFININDIEELKSKNFKDTKEYYYSELEPREKWLRYFDFASETKKYNNLVKMSVFGKVSRGIATGANNFFIINKTIIEQHKLEPSVCVPCLAKASDVKDIVFTKSSFQRLAEADKKVYIFDGTKAASKNDFLYIKYGEAIGANRSYLTSHRTIWYSIEEKKAAPILICVFNRNKIKIIRNEANIKNLTTFHCLYLNDNEEFSNIMFCYLLTPIAQELLYLSRREYGNGLTKFEPNDLTNADIIDLRIIDENDKHKILEIYKKIKEANTVIMINELDAIFRRYTRLPNVIRNEHQQLTLF